MTKVGIFHFPKKPVFLLSFIRIVVYTLWEMMVLEIFGQNEP